MTAILCVLRARPILVYAACKLVASYQVLDRCNVITGNGTKSTSTIADNVLECAAAMRLAGLLLLAEHAGLVRAHEYYTFLADRGECDGQCYYCKHSHNHAKSAPRAAC